LACWGVGGRPPGEYGTAISRNGKRFVGRHRFEENDCSLAWRCFANRIDNHRSALRLPFGKLISPASKSKPRRSAPERAPNSLLGIPSRLNMAYDSLSGGPMQNRSHAVMAQRIEAADSPDDFPTPPWATRGLMEHVVGSIGSIF
jgi:hypothetical protein